MSEELDVISVDVAPVCCQQPSLPQLLVIQAQVAIMTSPVVSSNNSMKLHNKDPAYGGCVGGGY